MSATIELNYDHSKGTARAFMSGSTLRVQATANSDSYIDSVVQMCDKGNNKTTNYGVGTSTVDFSSYGHTDCVYITVTVNFFGGSVTPAGECTIYTVVAEGEGTATPRSATVASGSTVRICATPAEGYTVAGWSKDSPARSSISISNACVSVRLTGAGRVIYYAHFDPPPGKASVGFDWSAVPEPNDACFDRSSWYTRANIAAGSSESSMHAIGSWGRVLFDTSTGYLGYIVGDGKTRHAMYGKDGEVIASGTGLYRLQGAKVTVRSSSKNSRYFNFGDTITCTFQVTRSDVWEALGFKFLGWSIFYVSADGSWRVLDDYGEPTNLGGDAAVSFVADKVPFSYIAANTTGQSASDIPECYRIYALIGACDSVKLEFLCYPSYSAELAVLNASITTLVDGVVVAWARTGAVVTLQVVSILRELGVVHGWSKSLAGASGGVASKSYPVPAEDSRVTVYICTHKLLYRPNQNKLLYGPGLKLLYDCSVPPGTRVYP